MIMRRDEFSRKHDLKKLCISSINELKDMPQFRIVKEKTKDGFKHNLERCESYGEHKFDWWCACTEVY